MDSTGSTRSLDLAGGEMIRLDDARGATLRVAQGQLWLTQEGDLQDVVLAEGDVFTVERNGITLVEARRRTSLTLTGAGRAPLRLSDVHVHPARRWRALVQRLALAVA